MDALTLVTGVTLSILAGAVPTAIYTLVVWWFDRYEKEPWLLLSMAFLWGAVPAVIISLVAENVFGLPLTSLSSSVADVVESDVIAPVVEELVKALAVFFIFTVFRHEFDDVLDGILYGALVGFGFGMTENVLYFLDTFFEDGWTSWGLLVFLRAVLFGFNHAFFTSITGAGLGYARLARRRWQRWGVPVLALLGAIAFHAIHNLSASLSSVTLLTLLVSLLSNWGGVLAIFVLILLAWQQEKRWIIRELREEVSQGVLPPEDYEITSSYRRRIVTQWRALIRDGWRGAGQVRRTYQLATELAFKKHQLNVVGEERGNAAEIARLRTSLTDRRTQT